MGGVKRETESMGAWESLVERMLTSLDEQNAERLEKCREVAKRKLARRGLKEPPIDKDAVKRYLLLYATLEKRQGLCLQESGIDRTMLLTAYDLWPESKFVRDYLAQLRHDANVMKHEDLVADAVEGLGKLNTGKGGDINAKAVMFTLENLDRDNFGDATRGGAGGRRSGVTYVIPNLSITNIMAPDEVASRRAKLAGAVVDAEVVEPALLGVGA